MVSNGERGYCPRCGAQLRRDQPMGAMCDPCGKAGPGPLPPGFFLHGPVRAALRKYDFGVFFRRVRGYQDWTQTTLGSVLGLSQTKISAIENGTSLYDIRVIARMHHRLGIPAPLLGFGDAATVAGGDTGQEEVSWVDRRDFNQHAAALALGLAGAAGLEFPRLAALLPGAEPTGTRHVGVADVEVIEQVTAEFVRQDYAAGGGLIRAAAVDQLRTALPLLNAQIADELRPRLMVATARLATIAGWANFEVERHDAARRLWLIGLGIARSTDHPLGTDLTAFLLYDMAAQALHLSRPKEAMHLIRVGHTVTGIHPVSASTTCALTNLQARVHAVQGDAKACSRALGQGVERFTSIGPATTPPWTAYLGETSLAAYQGDAYYDLARTAGDPQVAGRAVPVLLQAVEHFGSAHARSRAARLPALAGSHALAGNTDPAVTVGHQAVDAIASMSSPRLHDRLRVLNTVLAPLHTSPGVAELRERLTATAV